MQNNTKKAITKFTKQNNPTTKWNSNKTNVNEIKHAIFQMDNQKSPEILWIPKRRFISAFYQYTVDRKTISKNNEPSNNNFNS